uniref:Protein dpy-30 homolog n=2 Tax=Strongyloides TaxID=6247 RepID=A0A0K0FVR5_STRVS
MSEGGEQVTIVKDEIIRQPEPTQQLAENCIGEQTAPLSDNSSTSTPYQQQPFEGGNNSITDLEGSISTPPQTEEQQPMDITEPPKDPLPEGTTMQNENVPPTNNATQQETCELVEVPTRTYLDRTVVPILLQGLSALAKERPEQPIEFLANFLLSNKERYNPTLVSKPSE